LSSHFKSPMLGLRGLHCATPTALRNKHLMAWRDHLIACAQCKGACTRLADARWGMSRTVRAGTNSMGLMC
jgi:hypothetical protein